MYAPGHTDFTDGMQEAIGDLIGDLCHLAARHKIPPFEMLETGAEFYVNEIVCEENSLFLDVKATLNVLARRWPHDENGFTIGQESNEPYEVGQRRVGRVLARANTSGIRRVLTTSA